MWKTGRSVADVSDVVGAANQGFRLILAFVPVGKSFRGRVALSARRIPTKSIAAFSSDGGTKRAGSYPSAIQQSRMSSEKFQLVGKV
jgi:hypothetical protein